VPAEPAGLGLRGGGGDERRRTAHARGHEHARGGRLRSLAVRVKRAVARDRAGLVAAGVAFYVLLSLFPALAAVSIYGLVSDPAAIQRQLASLTMLPAEARELLRAQLEALVTQPRGQLGFALGGSILLAVWSATKGTKSLMQAFNIAHRVRETRGFVRKSLVALAATVVAILLVLVAVFAIGAVPQLLGSLGLAGGSRILAQVGTWIVLAAFVAGVLALAYRYLPAPQAPRHVVKPGVTVAVPVWLVGSALFSLYVARFGTYDKTYGTLGAAVILILWLWVTSYVVLIGAEVNRAVYAEDEGHPLPEEPEPA
jgi:membrane protein